MFVMIIVCILLFVWMMLLIFGIRLRKYRTDMGCQLKCDLCSDAVERLVGVSARTPHFKHIKGGPLKVPRRPIRKDGYYAPNVELIFTDYEVCSDCLTMLEKMLNESQGPGVLEVDDND